MAVKTVVFFNFVTHFGGAQQSTVLLCKRLKQFYNVYVIDAYGCCDLYLDAFRQTGIPTRVLLPNAEKLFIGYRGKPLLRMWNAVRQAPSLWAMRKKLSANIKEIKPDLVWTVSSKALCILASGFGLREFPVAVYALGWYKKNQVSSIGRWLIKNRTDGVLAISNPTKKALQSWGVRGEKIHVVYDGVELNSVTRPAPEGVNEVLPCLNSNFKILVPASFLWTKGQHTAIKAAGMLKQQGVDFVMWLTGGTALGGTSEYSDYLKKLIYENGLQGKVYLLGWIRDIKDLMRLSDVVVLPTYTEGLPRSIVEAMVLKRPVITTPVGGIPDLIVDGRTGLLFPVEDEKALSSCLQRIAGDRDLRLRLAESAYKRIYNEFHPDKQIRLVVEAFEKIITEKRKKN
jgi:glycosyltransferase involved in cell wall biosynthesis